MAGVAGFGAAGYWSEDASDEEQQLVYVPGLQTEGNLRSAPKSKTSISEGRKSNSQKPLLSSKMDLQRQQEQQVSPDEGGIKSASLKDLCPEDKRRIANLIKELARVSEEKEVTEERLKTEQESFEKKIRQLEDQNNLIGTEREALQQQYRECQELLSLYQTYLSEQQNKLHESPRRTRQVCEVNQHPTAGELNGSYLGQSHLRPGSDTSSSRSYGTNRRCRNDPACPIGFHVPNAVGRCCAKLPDRSLAQCCLHSASGNAHSTPARHPPERSSPCTHGNGIQTPPKKSSVSEERKHQLLLQKLELEVEKERLQQLLVQQETKLLVKQQQLQQSRLQRNSRSPMLINETRPSSDPIPMANSFRYRYVSLLLLRVSQFTPVVSQKSQRLWAVVIFQLLAEHP
ncbi:hypothetical protein XELAEV_18008513mg [Xenopus laevis]|uniref:Protein hinderin n=1 Tax=Xenopus laevis TaxID=8355 RepID=A0A974E3Q9_XENLA|nr:hypothetical protein XELAEV_18008513mg [Xenopus laevis]